jgi:hypothetical protein
MMGSKGELSGPERDAFSRRSRPMLNWRPSEIRKLKRAFAKRERRQAKLVSAKDADPET